MTTHETPTTPKGPASYFPAIERKYGRPIAYWLDLVRQMPGAPHMAMVGRLKAEHGMGHGHANAVVAHVLAEAKAPGGAGSR
jgi:hypothetical protein